MGLCIIGANDAKIWRKVMTSMRFWPEIMLQEQMLQEQLLQEHALGV